MRLKTKVFLISVSLVVSICESCTYTSVTPSTSTAPNTSSAFTGASTPAESMEALEAEKRNDKIYEKKGLNNILKGEVYTVVPQEMKVGIESLIEAGFAPKITQKIRKEFQRKRNVNITITTDVSYDPHGTAMDLDTPPGEFQVTPIQIDRIESITEDFPGKWTWRIKPLKSGKKVIIIKATYQLTDIKNKIKSSRTIVVFEKEVVVLVNPSYSTSNFFNSNWREVLGLIFGSGSIAGIIKWVIDNKNKKGE
jgi:hypothetical protein